MTHPPIVAIGDLAADVIVSIPRLPVSAGQHQLAHDIRLEPGGSANLLIAGARQGWPTAAIGTLGADVWGERVAAIIRAQGVDLTCVQHGGTTTTVIVLVGAEGEHLFLGKYGEGPKMESSPQIVRRVESAGAVFCSGYTLSETRLVDLALEMMRLARAAGAPVCFDPGPQMAAVPADLHQPVLSLTDILLLTEEEIPLLAGIGSLADLVRRGPQTVVVKRGGNGCAVYTAGQIQPVVKVAGHSVPVVDSSAAGDSFNAGFIVGLLRNWPLASCARLANAAGAAKVQKLGGGRSMPTLAEVQAVLDG